MTSSDDELEKISTFAMVKEQLDSKRRLRSCRGSGRCYNTIWHNSLQGQENLFSNYFVKLPLYPPNVFWRRFRVHHDFLLHSLCSSSSWTIFCLKKKCCWKALAFFPTEDDNRSYDAHLWSNEQSYRHTCELEKPPQWRVLN